MSAIRGNTDFEYQLAVAQGNARRIKTLIKHKIAPPQGLMLFGLIRQHPELLPLLKEAGCDPNDRDGFNERALGRAINRYDLPVTETLLRLGANPDLESLHLLPLVIAICCRKFEHVRTLLQGGANPNMPQWNGVIPLWSAVRCDEIEIAKLLLSAGADPTVTGPAGKTAIQLARSLKHKPMLDLLKQAV